MRRSAILSVLLCGHLSWSSVAWSQATAEGVAEQSAFAANAKAPREAPEVQHFPIHEAIAGEAELRFVVRAPDRAGKIAVRCSSLRQPAREHQVFAERATSDYRVQLPAACVAVPGFRYYAVRITTAGEQPLFASAAAPHRVRVSYSEEYAAELRRLHAHGYQRSRVLLAAEGVDFGARDGANGATLQDRYYRLEAGYAYAFYQRIEDISLTLVRVRGEAGVLADEGGQALAPGIDFGRAAVTWLAFDFLRLRSALLLGASQQGFEYGGSGELVLGDPLAEHIILGAESVTTLGTSGFLSLGFNATPAIPMEARVELTDFPLGRDAAVRLLYSVGYRFTPVTELLVRAGYQGRTSVIGGPSIGAALRYGF